MTLILSQQQTEAFDRKMHDSNMKKYQLLIDRQPIRTVYLPENFLPWQVDKEVVKICKNLGCSTRGAELKEIS